MLVTVFNSDIFDHVSLVVALLLVSKLQTNYMFL